MMPRPSLTAAPFTGLLYRLAAGVAIFSGMGQMPILKRYYFTELPLMGWSEDFFILSNLHYLAAGLLLMVLAWRITVTRGLGQWSWGPRSWWGWLLLALLIVSGSAKMLRNSGVYLDPGLIMALDFTHLGSAMAFMFTGLGRLLVHTKPARPTPLAGVKENA